jgi:phage-related protein
MPTDWRNELFAIHGHEGTASFLWRRPLTQSVYVEGEQFDMPDGDVWNVDQLIVV